MKTVALRNLIPITIMLSFTGWTQVKNEIKITDLEIPNAPALSLLDASNTVIETPKNLKALTSTLANSIGNDFAIEITPYFFLKKNKSFYDFNGYKLVDGKPIQKSALSNAYSSFSVSVASVRKENISYVSIGLRSNLLKLRNSKQTAYYEKAEKIYQEKIYTLYVSLDPEELAVNEDYKKYSKEYNDMLDLRDAIKPLLSFDIAAAYSQFYENNVFSEESKGKTGAWITISYNYLLNPNSENNFQYFSIYLLGRYLNDPNYHNQEVDVPIERNNRDIGCKIELEFDDLSLGYEYVARTNEKDNYRSVGTIKYKISNEVLLNGGFGKNFERTDNLVTFLGINWGIDLGKNVFENKK